MPTARLSNDALIPLATFDPAGPLDDLEWLEDIGDARVVAIGEARITATIAISWCAPCTSFSSSGIDCCGTWSNAIGSAPYAMESGFVAGW